MRQLQGNLPKACFRTPREVDEASAVHSCFFSKGVFRDALNTALEISGKIVYNIDGADNS